MSNSQRERRRRNRRKAKAKSSTIRTLLRENHQKYGATGVINFVAHFAHEPSVQSEVGSPEQRPSAKTSGLAYVSLIAEEPGKLGASALAAAAEVWPDEDVRQAAAEALQGRRKQLSGVLRRLDSIAVSDVWRLTDEYRDCETLLIELAVDGEHLMTLAATTDSLRRSWMSLSVLSVPASLAIDHFHLPDVERGLTRQIFEQLEAKEMRLETWMLTSRRKIEGEQSAKTVLSWVERLLEVDVEWPELPKFLSSDEYRNDDCDEYEPDIDDELDLFLRSEEGSSWQGDRFDEVIDHLRGYDSGRLQMNWSPAKVEDFLMFTDHDYAGSFAHVLPALLRRWAAHCARVRRQRKPLLMAVLAEIDRCEPEFFRAAA